MAEEARFDETRARGKAAVDALRGLGSEGDMQAAKPLVMALRNQRDYALMGELAEQISRRDPKDATNRRLYGQYLIDTGKVTAAIDVLQVLTKRLSADDPEFAEATGLLGRAYKQIFFDAGDKGSTGAREALKKAITTYRIPYEKDPSNTWHGVNLAALLTRARALGMRVAPDLDPVDIARQVRETLEQQPSAARDEWFLPTLAEAALGMRDLDAVEWNVRAYAATSEAKAFQIASTLRQFTEVWDLERSDPRGRALVDILRSRLMQLDSGHVVLEANQLQKLRQQEPAYDGQLEAVLGREGTQTYKWWKTGLDRALSVAAIYQKLGGRFGTGFLVRAGDLGREPEDELLVLTNCHVVNKDGEHGGIRPEEADVVFEAVDAATRHSVAAILWSSPPERHDATLLRLATPIPGIAPLPIATALPVLDPKDPASVYVIGYPGGRDLAFSFQDNELLDHEGQPLGKPQIPGVCRLHYRAPTEGGSSGSPVFNSRLWQVIALHHKGGKLGMSKLNGQAGTYAANEGIAIQSIVAAMKQ